MPAKNTASPAKPQAQSRGRLPLWHSRHTVPDTPDCDPEFRECGERDGFLMAFYSVTPFTLSHAAGASRRACHRSLKPVPSTAPALGLRTQGEMSKNP